MTMLIFASLAMAQEVTVSGTVEAQGYIYDIPQERNYSVSPHDFVWDDPQGSGTYTSVGGHVNVTEGSLRAGVHLPDGATITGLFCAVRDTSSTLDIDVFLRRVTNVGVSEPIGFATTSGASGFPGDFFVSQTSGLSNTVVDNHEYAYHVQYNPDDGCAASQCRIYKCRIRYEVDVPLP